MLDDGQDHIRDLRFPQAERIAYLISGYIRETLTNAEHEELDDWAAASDENMQLFEELTDKKNIQKALDWINTTNTERAFKRVKRRLSFAPARSFRKYWYYSVAASFTLCIAILLFINFKNTVTVKPESPTVAVLQDVAPGGDRAILTLADGSTIVLNQAEDGTLATQGNSRITKQSGSLAYSTTAASGISPLYNTITTPRGGTYLLTLSDGTRIWLNAASSIRFPVIFTGDERRVAMTGEVYFEVAKNAARPFRVEVKDRSMEVEVLGTHFNINAYTDETSIETTLLEGSVKVSGAGKQAVLKPGQQSQFSPASLLSVREADTDQAIAWRNGLFQFSNAEITELMRQLSRWYDIEVKYEGVMPAIRTTGKAPRNISLASLLKILELSGIHYKIEEGKLIVMP